VRKTPAEKTYTLQNSPYTGANFLQCGRRIHIFTKSTIMQEINSKISVPPSPRRKNGKWVGGWKPERNIYMKYFLSEQ